MRISVKEALKAKWIEPDLARELARKEGGRADRKPRARKREAEGQEQAELVAWFEQAHPDIGSLLIHIPNGGSRKNAYEGWRLKQQGVRAGVSDLFLAVARGAYHGLWIEFKASAPYTAALSKEQARWIARMREQGYCAYACIGLAQAARVINAYLALPVARAHGKKLPAMAIDTRL